MKHPTIDDLFKTYRPKGLPCTKFTDPRYEKGVIADTSILEEELPSIDIGPSSQEPAFSNYRTDYMREKKQEVLCITREYIEMMGLHESLQDDMINTFNMLFPLLPKGSKMHNSSQLAEIVAFHTLKEKGLFIDPDEFLNASFLGDMPMSQRSWLLRYKRFLPSNSRLPPSPAPDNFLNQLYNMPEMTEVFRHRCEEIKPVIMRLSGNLHPKMIAGVICFMASKTTPLPGTSMKHMLNAMGIKHAGSIHNVVKRLGDRWKSVWAVFFKKEVGACRD
jgi:hypothetical protein